MSIRNLFLIFLLLAAKANAQQSTPDEPAPGRVLIKTNLLYDVTSTLNLGAEVHLSDRFSLDIPISFNPWKLSSDRYWKHFLFQPELRYWTTEQPEGHFFGVHAHYGTYNVMKTHRYDGWLAGAGVSYGYRWKFNPRWSLEATIGLGYAYLDYDKYEAGEEEMTAVGNYNYFGPTRAGVTLSYTLGSNSNHTAKVKQSRSARRAIAYRAPAAVTTPIKETPVTQEETAVPQNAPINATTEEAPAAPAATATERVEKGTAYLDYAKGSSAINYDFGGNAQELRKIHELIENIQQNPYARITGISLVGHASPEGYASDNVLLSAERARALKDHLKIVHTLAETLFTSDGRGEDWHTIDRLVVASDNIKKYMILEIIRGTRDADEREIRLREEWPDFYEQLRRETYPRLRRIEYEVTYTITN